MVIAARVNTGTNQFIVQNAATESFSIAFDCQCHSVEYTALSFEVDTSGGCTVAGSGTGSAAVDLSEYRYFGIHGRTCRGLFISEIPFFYGKVGRTTNAQRGLKSVVRQCA
jgi:hypothetical protein